MHRIPGVYQVIVKTVCFGSQHANCAAVNNILRGIATTYHRQALIVTALINRSVDKVTSYRIWLIIEFLVTYFRSNHFNNRISKKLIWTILEIFIFLTFTIFFVIELANCNTNYSCNKFHNNILEYRNRIPRTAINEIIALGFASCYCFNNRISRNPITVYYYIFHMFTLWSWLWTIEQPWSN